MSIPPDWFRRAVEVVPYGVACVSQDHVFLYVNRHYCELVGYSQAELTGRTWMSITADDDVGGDLKSVNDLMKEGGQRDTYQLQKRYIHKAGHLVPVVLDVFVFFESGRISLFVACVSGVENSAEAVKNIERNMRTEMTRLQGQLSSIQDGIEFRKKVIDAVKKHWSLIAGLVTLAATAIWNIARSRNE